VGGQRHAPSALPQERRGTRRIGGWVGLRAGLDGCRKSRRPPGFDPQTVQPVASRFGGVMGGLFGKDASVKEGYVL